MAAIRLLPRVSEGSAAISSSASGWVVVDVMVGPTPYGDRPIFNAFAVMLGEITALALLLPWGRVKLACPFGEGSISMFPRATGVLRCSATVIKRSGCSDSGLLPCAAASPARDETASSNVTYRTNARFVRRSLIDYLLHRQMTQTG